MPAVDDAAVRLRRAEADLDLALDQTQVEPEPAQRPGDGTTDDAAADDDDILHPLTVSFPDPGSSGRKSVSEPSADPSAAAHDPFDDHLESHVTGEPLLEDPLHLEHLAGGQLGAGADRGDDSERIGRL